MRHSLVLLICFSLVTSFQKRQLTWVAIGDSITYLNNHQDETGNRVTKGYMTMVTERLPHIKYTNQGHNGWTSGGIAKEFDNLGITSADIYSIFLGTNDWWQGRPLGTFNDYINNTGNGTVHGSFRIIFDKLRSLNKQAKIVLITPMQRGDFVYISNMKNSAFGSYKEKNGQRLEQFANALQTIAKHEQCLFVDLYHKSGINQRNMIKFKWLRDPADKSKYKRFRYPEYINVPFNPETDEYPYPGEAIDMTYDGLHPSDKGYQVISNMLVKHFKSF